VRRGCPLAQTGRDERGRARTGSFGDHWASGPVLSPVVETVRSPSANVGEAMGSLIKKRRKRMRKKKHKKMLKATRWQRRAGK
jgi:hypothetical protein